MSELRQAVLEAANKAESGGYNFYNAYFMERGPAMGVGGQCAVSLIADSMPEDVQRNVRNAHGIQTPYHGRVVDVRHVAPAVLGISEAEFYNRMDALEMSPLWRESGFVAARVLRQYAQNFTPA